ncbi:hypothetical protein [Streptomyces sp. SID12488]|uniref:hypothetical protein n=1 Tax=Streptomyces sp. SID12488 TaxID=2706040 RepID=UPI0013DAAAB9|nr:hypothetical protein [Streptomyces sp. SID12488]NEA62369.1 hypothetical protein [Streptomyces sp. SID12488]
MSSELKPLIAQAGDFLKREYGFRVKGRIAIREDQLLRSVVFHPEKTATKGACRFDVTLNLGLPGLSSMSPTRRIYVVSASLGKISRLRDPARGRFELTGENSDTEVISNVLSLLSDLCSDFFISLPGPSDLLDLLDNPEEFKRLDLWPWNELPRLELASVYCAFLGKGELASQWEGPAIQCALDGGMEYAVERVRANVAEALEARRRASGLTE